MDLQILIILILRTYVTLAKYKFLKLPEDDTTVSKHVGVNIIQRENIVKYICALVGFKKNNLKLIYFVVLKFLLLFEFSLELTVTWECFWSRSIQTAQVCGLIYLHCGVSDDANLLEWSSSYDIKGPIKSKSSVTKWYSYGRKIWQDYWLIHSDIS